MAPAANPTGIVTAAKRIQMDNQAKRAGAPRKRRSGACESSKITRLNPTP